MADRLKVLAPQQLVAAGTEGYYVDHPECLFNSGTFIHICIHAYYTFLCVKDDMHVG